MHSLFGKQQPSTHDQISFFEESKSQSRSTNLFQSQSSPSFKITFWIAVDDSLEIKKKPGISLLVKHEKSSYYLEKTQAARLSLLIRDYLIKEKNLDAEHGQKREDQEPPSLELPSSQVLDHEIFEKLMELLAGKYDVEIPINKLLPFGHILKFLRIDLESSLKGQTIADMICKGLTVFFKTEYYLDIYVFAKLLELSDLRKTMEEAIISEARVIIAPIRKPRLTEEDLLDLLDVHLKKRETAFGDTKKKLLQNHEIKPIIDSYYPFRVGDAEYHDKRIGIIKRVTNFTLETYVESDSRFQFEMLKEENIYLEKKLPKKSAGDISKVIGRILCKNDTLEVLRTNSLVNLFEYKANKVDALSFKVTYLSNNLGLRSVTVFRPYLGSIKSTIFTLIEGDSCKGPVLRKFPVDMNPIKGLYESRIEFDFPVAIDSNRVYTMMLFYDEVSTTERTYSKAGEKCSKERLIDDIVVTFLPAKDNTADNLTDITFGQFQKLEFVIYDKIKDLEENFYIYPNQVE